MKKKKDSPIGMRLKAARVAKLLSQKHLGMAAGFDELSAASRINQYEKLKNNPDYYSLKSLSEVLHVPVSYFYEEDDKLAEIILNYSKLNFKLKLQMHKHSKELIKALDQKVQPLNIARKRKVKITIS